MTSLKVKIARVFTRQECALLNRFTNGRCVVSMVTEHQREAGLSWVSVMSTFSPYDGPSFLLLANYLCSYTLYVGGSARDYPWLPGGITWCREGLGKAGREATKGSEKASFLPIRRRCVRYP